MLHLPGFCSSLSTDSLAGPPVRSEAERKRTYKTKDEVEKTKGVSTAVVGTLLVIACLVPMLQYYGYTAKE